MTKSNINEIKIIAERMMIESRTDTHTCKKFEDYCAGCQKMRDALNLLRLTGDPTIYTIQ